MTVTAARVKEVRERTGVGMMECKKALVEAVGDIEVAIELLRKSGAAKAAKKAGRITAEGLIALASKDQRAVLVEVNCETDFVAKDENFRNFSDAVGGDDPRSLAERRRRTITITNRRGGWRFGR